MAHKVVYERSGEPAQVVRVVDLARDAAAHLDVAATYKLDELRTAIDHVGRPGKTGLVVVTTS
jgi:hypothetical protein